MVQTTKLPEADERLGVRLSAIAARGYNLRYNNLLRHQAMTIWFALHEPRQDY